MVGEGFKLSVLEIRKLAIGFYGFSYLFKETGMEQYQRLSHKLANNFIGVYNRAENDSGKDQKGCINSEMDLLTQALVAVALFDLGEKPENDYRETSSRFFQHILAALSEADKDTKLQSSFVLFYYLFEYEKRLQHISEDVIKKQSVAHSSFGNKFTLHETNDYKHKAKKAAHWVSNWVTLTPCSQMFVSDGATYAPPDIRIDRAFRSGDEDESFNKFIHD
jgi:hypothetical protein